MSASKAGTKARKAGRRAGIYCRISQDHSGQGLGVERQESTCRKRAAELGWQVAGVYPDNDVSASSNKPRPQYRRLLADLKAGVIDAVVVWDLDRLTRKPIEIEEFINLADEHAIALASVDRDVDLSTDNGRLFARIKGAVARAEVERKSARTKAANLQAAEQGKPRGGQRPFGWLEDKVTPHPVEAQAVREAVDGVLAGHALGEVARRWNARGLTTTTGREWRTSTVRQVLKRARNAGLSDYRGEVLSAGQWEALVPEETWRALCTLLNDPSRRSKAGNKPRWLLSGIALCGKPGCDHTVKKAFVSNPASPHLRQRDIYICRGGGHISRSAVALDEYVTMILLHRLSRPDAVKLLMDEASSIDLAGLHKEARTLRGRQEALAVEAANGDITPAQMRTINRSIGDKLQAIEAQIASASETSVLAQLVGYPDVQKRWDQLSLLRKRAVVDTLLTIKVLPVGKGGRTTFDPASIEVSWRQPGVPVQRRERGNRVAARA